MSEQLDSEKCGGPRVGRPRRGTEAVRADQLLAAATRIFLQGYGSASIDKVASEAGVSTRTIYERYKNKAELLAAVISRLIETDMANALAPDGLAHLSPRQALLSIGRVITSRASDPSSAGLFRILATEARRFPELAAKMRGGTKAKVDCGVAAYLLAQTRLGTLRLADPNRAAVLFLQMVSSEVRDCMLFGSPDELAQIDLERHLEHVVDIFLHGAVPREPAPRGA